MRDDKFGDIDSGGRGKEVVCFELGIRIFIILAIKSNWPVIYLK